MRSNETPYCPHCERALRAVGSRTRSVRRNDGSLNKLIIRRLRCDHCKRIHHELPDENVPFKRYSAKAIEEILSSREEGTYPCEISTAARLRIWFSLLHEYFERALNALKYLYKQDEQFLEELSSLIPFIPTRFSAGWLRRLVRILVNSGFWPQTRSA